MRQLQYGNLPPFLSPGVDLEVGKFLHSIESPLENATVEIDPELAQNIATQPMPHTIPMLVRRVSIVFHIPPQTILTIMQAEQGVLSLKQKPWTDYSVRRLNDDPTTSPPMIPPLWGGDWHRINSKRGWLAWDGDPKMVMMCGAGIMGDPKDQARRLTEAYLGPARQIYWAGRIACSCLNRWNAGERVATIDGEQVECDSKEAFFLLNYTPHAEALGHRAKIWYNYFSHA